MRTVKKTKEVEVYVCNKCLKEYDLPYRAEDCELRHKKESCKHKHQYIEYRLQTYGYDGGYHCISKQCNNCGTQFKDVNLDEVLSEKVLETAYESYIKKKKK